MNSKFRVLLALENEAINEQVHYLLSEHYDVRTAHDADDVYHLIHTFQPWLAVLDYNLTTINPIDLHEGVEFLHPQTKFVICVTTENLEVARRVWCKRAIDYIRKPIDQYRIRDDINKIVRHIIDQHEIRTLETKITAFEKENEKLRRLL